MHYADAVIIKQHDSIVTLEFTYGKGEDRHWVSSIELPNDTADELLANLAAQRQVRLAQEARDRSRNSRHAS